MSKVIRTRNGEHRLPAKTVHLGIKASRIGGRNVWEHTKGKLEQLSETTAQNNPENQAIDRVQKRIMRHAPKSISITGKAIGSGVRVSKKLIQSKYANAQAKKTFYANTQGKKATQAQKVEVTKKAIRQKSNQGRQARQSIAGKQNTIRSKTNFHRSKTNTKIRSRAINGKAISLRAKKALFQQVKQGIRTKQGQQEKASIENSASANVEKVALKVSPTLAKKGVKVAVLPIRLGKRAIWTIARKKQQADQKDAVMKQAKEAMVRQKQQVQIKQNKWQIKQNKLRTKPDIFESKAKSMDRNDVATREKMSRSHTELSTKTSQTHRSDAKDIYNTNGAKNTSNRGLNASNNSMNHGQNIDPKYNKERHRPELHRRQTTQEGKSIRLRNTKGEIHTRNTETSSKHFRFKHQATQQKTASLQTNNKTIHTRKKWFTIRKKRSQSKQQAKVHALQQAKTIAIRAMRRSAQMVEKSVKAIAMAIKALIAGVGGGALLIGLIVLIAGAALISASPFGIFFGAEKPETHHIPAVVDEINAEFMQQVSANASDEIDIEGDSPVYNWIDVLAVFAVKTSTDMSNPLDVGTMDETKKAMLKQVFYDMNEISTITETVTETDSDGNQTTKTITKTMVVGKTWEEMIPIYNFNEEQEKLLREIMQGEYYEMFIELIGLPPAQASPLTPDQWADLDKELPAGANTSEIVKKAFERLGDPYSQPKRGQGRYVDCSYFTRWVYRHFGVELAGTAAEQARWCVDNNLTVSYNNLQAGDLVFFASGTNGRYLNVNHVGIVRPARTK